MDTHQPAFKRPSPPFPWIGSDTPHLRDEIRDYFNCINRLDEGIGLTLGHLDDLGMRKNTLIVYISDHGADFPRGKGSVYENGVRIPMIVNYPKQFSQGKVEPGMVSTLDLLPTFLSGSSLDIPDSLPGFPLQLLDSGARKARDYIHTFTTGSSPNLLYLQFAVRDHRNKLIYNPDRALNRLGLSRYKNSQLPESQHVLGFLYPPEFELYDLKEDPHEWNNLATSPTHREVAKRLHAEMTSFQESIKDPFADPSNVKAFLDEQKLYQSKPYRRSQFRWPHLAMFSEAQDGFAKQIVYQQRKIPAGVPLKGHASDATTFGYRIPSLLVTQRGTILAFSERRLGLHDHAQNDIVLRRSHDNGRSWDDEIVVHEDGMNSINDPLTVQLENGRILLMFARFPYGTTHANLGVDHYGGSWL